MSIDLYIILVLDPTRKVTFFPCPSRVQGNPGMPSHGTAFHLEELTLNLRLLSISSFGGSQYSHKTTNNKNPTMTLHKPPIQGQAPEMAQERGHSSCAK